MTRPMTDRRLQHTRVSSEKTHHCGACKFYLQIRGSSTFDKNRLSIEFWKRKSGFINQYNSKLPEKVRE